MCLLRSFRPLLDKACIRRLRSGERMDWMVFHLALGCSLDRLLGKVCTRRLRNGERNR